MQLHVVRVQLDTVSANAAIPVCFHLRALRGERPAMQSWGRNANRQPAIGSGNMSSEQNAPEVQMQQGPPSPTAQMDGQMDQNGQPRMDQNGQPQDSAHNVQHGMGQSKSSRRRRRKRKNTSPDALQQGVQ